MKKTANWLTISMLAISALILVGGTALGIDYGNMTPTATVAVTNTNYNDTTIPNATTTPYVEETNATTSEETNATTTPYVEETNATDNNTTNVTESNASETTVEATPAETEVVSIPTETEAPIATEMPTPVPTPKSPGFESIITIAAVLIVGCLIGIRRR